MKWASREFGAGDAGRGLREDRNSPRSLPTHLPCVIDRRDFGLHFAPEEGRKAPEGVRAPSEPEPWGA